MKEQCHDASAKSVANPKPSRWPSGIEKRLDAELGMVEGVALAAAASDVTATCGISTEVAAPT